MRYLLVLLFLVSCQDSGEYVHYDKPPLIEKSSRSFLLRNVLQDNRIDILWVVDNSGSMGSIQSNIILNSALFMEEFKKNNILDWQMGIVSTDRSESPDLGFKDVFNSKSPDPVETFQNGIQALGTSGSGYEFVFYNIQRALQIKPPFNNFYRENAHFAVIMVTDEPEQSEGNFGAQYEAINFLSSISALKDAKRVIRFYGAFNLADLEECPRNRSYRYAGSPFEKVISLTDGIVMSACSSDFGTKMAEIGKDIVSILDTPRIILKKRPVIKTLAVYFNGMELPAGKESEGGYWYYSEYFNTINFYNLEFAPDISNASIKIDYDIDDGFDHDEWRD